MGLISFLFCVARIVIAVLMVILAPIVSLPYHETLRVENKGGGSVIVRTNLARNFHIGLSRSERTPRRLAPMSGQRPHFYNLLGPRTGPDSYGGTVLENSDAMTRPHGRLFCTDEQSR